MALCGNYQGNELKSNSSGNTRPQSSQFSEPLFTVSGLKSGIAMLELISTLKKEEKAQVGKDSLKLRPKIFACEEKAIMNV